MNPNVATAVRNLMIGHRRKQEKARELQKQQAVEQAYQQQLKQFIRNKELLKARRPVQARTQARGPSNAPSNWQPPATWWGGEYNSDDYRAPDFINKGWTGEINYPNLLTDKKLAELAAAAQNPATQQTPTAPQRPTTPSGKVIPKFLLGM